MVRWEMPSPVITIFVVQFMLSAFILDLAVTQLCMCGRKIYYSM